MNIEFALDMKGRLRQVIDAYEAFLYKEIQDATDNSIVATEALIARDATRTIGMSEVARTRIKRVSQAPVKPNPNGELQTGTSTSNLVIGGLQPIGGIGPQSRPNVDPNDDSLFRNLKDCIPCNHLWDWGDFDLDRLKDLFALDLKARLGWLLGWEDIFNQNFVLEELCQILSLFANLCPQDLAALITLLLAYIAKVIASIKFNFEGILKDILGMLLQPYIQGLEDFLRAYLQFIVAQIDCILASIQAAAQAAADFGVRNNLGPDSLHFNVNVIDEFGNKSINRDEFLRELENIKQGYLAELKNTQGLRERTPDEIDRLTPSVVYNSLPIKKRQRLSEKYGLTLDPRSEAIIDTNTGGPLVTERGEVEGFAQDVGAARMFLKEGANDIASFIGNAPRFLSTIIAEAKRTVEGWVKDVQDSVIEFLGGEWLVTGQNLGLIQLQRSVSTIIQILKIVLKIGAGEDLCNEDNIKRVIDEVNRVNPDVVVVNDSTGGTIGNPSLPSANVPSQTPGSTNGQGATSQEIVERQRLSASKVINFNLKKCLSIGRTDATLEEVERYIRGLL